MPAFDAVRHYFRAGSLDETTRRSVGRTLDTILHITLAGCALALLANLAAGLWKTAIGLGLAILVFSVALVLRRRGHQEVATVLTLVTVVGTVQVLVSVGSGSHDYATLLYPVAIIVSALLLDRRLLALSSLLTLSSALGTLVAEDLGLLVTRTSGCYGSIGIEHYADVVVILVATALVSHLVVEGIVR